MSNYQPREYYPDNLITAPVGWVVICGDFKNKDVKARWVVKKSIAGWGFRADEGGDEKYPEPVVFDNELKCLEYVDSWVTKCDFYIFGPDDGIDERMECARRLVRGEDEGEEDGWWI